MVNQWISCSNLAVPELFVTNGQQVLDQANIDKVSSCFLRLGLGARVLVKTHDLNAFPEWEGLLYRHAHSVHLCAPIFSRM